MKRKLRHILLTLIHGLGFVLLYIVVKDMDWDKFLNLFGKFPVYKFFLGLLMLFLVYLLKAFRWYLINRSFDITIPFTSTLAFYLVAGFLSVITPGRLGELVKVYFLRKKTSVSNTKAFSTVILDRIWDVMILSLMAGMSMVFLFSKFRVNIPGIAIIISFFILSILIIVFPGILFAPLLFFTRRFKKFNSEIKKIYSLWTLNRVRYFIPSFLITVTAFGILALIPLLFAPEIDAIVPFSASISAVSISNILSFIPVTLAGFGTREYVFVEIWQFFGHGEEAALTISTAQFFCTYIGSLLMGGIIYISGYRNIFSFKDLKAEKKSM